MHGAGLMNQIFMQPGSAVIEIFPVHLKQVLYERVAHYSGLYHFKVRWQVGSPRAFLKGTMRWVAPKWRPLNNLGCRCTPQSLRRG
jgi:hypothetical protein